MSSNFPPNLNRPIDIDLINDHAPPTFGPKPRDKIGARFSPELYEAQGGSAV